MFDQLLNITKYFYKSERFIFWISGIIFVLSGVVLALNLFQKSTVRVAVAGGTYAEGVIGQPVYINPVISGANDVDRDLVRLIFSNVYDVSEKIEVSEDGAMWVVRVSENALWHDGVPVTSDDIIFTIQGIQDPDSRSPLLGTLQDVAIERVSERELKLKLPTPYAFFGDNLKNIYVVPKHIFESVPVANWRLSSYNLEPIGSGPYRFESSLVQRNGFISELVLKRNDDYAKGKPLIESITVKFFKNEDELFLAFDGAQIDGFMMTDARNISRVRRGHQSFRLPTSLYYAVFFNQSAHPALRDKNVRFALGAAIPKDELVSGVLGGNGIAIGGPLERFVKNTTSTPLTGDDEIFSAQSAGEIFEKSEWKIGEDGVRAKNNVRLEFRLAVPQYSSLIDVARFIEEKWKLAGVKVDVEILSPADINKELIRARNYEMILFGNSLWSPDLFSFWHSSERFYPGLNLALYENRSADKLIESIRKNFNEESRNSDLVSLDSLIRQGMPAVFLYSPNYVYVASANFGGLGDELLVTASDRLNNVKDWYVRTALNLKK